MQDALTLHHLLKLLKNFGVPVQNFLLHILGQYNFEGFLCGYFSLNFAFKFVDHSLKILFHFNNFLRKVCCIQFLYIPKYLLDSDNFHFS